jgi:hypothetical protein
VDQWFQQRERVLQGQPPDKLKASALEALDHDPREKLDSMTDDTILENLRMVDRQNGFWIDEDPALRDIKNCIRYTIWTGQPSRITDSRLMPFLL